MRLIDADAIQIASQSAKQIALLRHTLAKQPTIDPVNHGHWIADDCDCQCSVCKEIFTFEVSMHECHPIDDMQMYYCQHCGAKMDLEVSE